MARFTKNDIISLVASAPRYDLAESVGPDLRLAELMTAGALDDLALGYGTAEGDSRLRAEIAALHGVGAEEVVITVGGIQALFLLAFILCRDGDEAVAATPLFPAARGALESVGASVRSFPLGFDQGYQPDLAALGAVLSSRTRLVSLASPQNPSGVAIRPDILRQVLALMAERCPDAVLLVDETYREAAYGDDPVAPSALALGRNVVSTASLSKCHGAPGLRIGWAITRDPALREQLVLGKFNTVISCSAIDEALALKVLDQRDRITGERRVRLGQGIQRVEGWITANRDLVEWVRPDAGALCCVRLRRQAFDDEAVARFYATLAGADVRVANGTWFGEEARVFRLGFGLMAMPELDAALAALSAVLRRAVRAAA